MFVPQETATFLYVPNLLWYNTCDSKIYFVTPYQFWIVNRQSGSNVFAMCIDRVAVMCLLCV